MGTVMLPCLMTLNGPLPVPVTTGAECAEGFAFMRELSRICPVKSATHSNTYKYWWRRGESNPRP